MRSFFRDIALLQHDDFITACHGAQFVGDNEHRFIFNQSADCLLDSCFIFRVYTGRAFIEQNHRRIFQKRPGNGKSLPLAAGKRFPVFADQGLIAIGKTRYKFIAGCQFCCCINFFFRCILFADFDVIVNRIVEQYDILKNNGIVFKKLFRCDFSQIFSSNRYRSAFHVPKSCRKTGKRTFAGTGWTDQCGYFALLCSEGNIVQDFFVIIGEADMVKPNIKAADAHILAAALLGFFQQLCHSSRAHQRRDEIAKMLTSTCQWFIDTHRSIQKNQKLEQADFPCGKHSRSEDNNKPKPNAHNIVRNGNGQTGQQLI